MSIKVALLNTYSHGGAGTAARRLEAALKCAGADAPLFFSEKTWPKMADALAFLPFEKDKAVRFQFSRGLFGQDLSKNSFIKNADIIHLHWINQGFLSIASIEKLLKLNKPIVWTLHDMWAFTGGCHYSRDCHFYENQCGNCHFLKNPKNGDISNQLWSKKKKLFEANFEKIQFITCSDWLLNIAKTSSLLKNANVQSIPNPIDPDIFKPLSPALRLAEREKFGIRPDQKVLLFVAMKISEERKGFPFLVQALEKLKAQSPDTEAVIAVLGRAEPDVLAALPYPTVALGFVSENEKLRAAYSMADAFCIPSLEDNLPNTVMESLACGTPVVGFETGGVPEMVDHLENGFIAPQKDTQKLAEGIEFLFSDETRLDRLRLAARQKVLEQYQNSIVAQRHLSLYQQLLEKRNAFN